MRRQKIWCNISPVQINKHRNRQSPDSNKPTLYNIAANSLLNPLQNVPFQY